MEEELEVMYKRKVWELTPLPADVEPLGCRWVYTIKRDDKGRIARYKARLVAQGYKQVKGVSYDETFSPVVNFSLIRFFFAALVSCYKWTHTQCDVKGAYLYAPLEDRIYIKQPPGFEIKGKERMVCSLRELFMGFTKAEEFGSMNK